MKGRLHIVLLLMGLGTFGPVPVRARTGVARAPTSDLTARAVAVFRRKPGRAAPLLVAAAEQNDLLAAALRTLEAEAKDILGAAARHSPELKAAMETWKEIKFEFDTVDKLDTAAG